LLHLHSKGALNIFSGSSKMRFERRCLKIFWVPSSVTLANRWAATRNSVPDRWQFNTPEGKTEILWAGARSIELDARLVKLT
jgi:hypothetical protein